MSKFKHAPGEWKILDHGYAHLGAHIMAGDERIASGVMEHNTRLIAAAPEMLDALFMAHAEMMVTARLQDWHSEEFRRKLDVIQKAIEKAIGMTIEEALK